MDIILNWQNKIYISKLKVRALLFNNHKSMIILTCHHNNKITFNKFFLKIEITLFTASLIHSIIKIHIIITKHSLKVYTNINVTVHLYILFNINYNSNNNLNNRCNLLILKIMFWIVKNISIILPIILLQMYKQSAMVLKL